VTRASDGWAIVSLIRGKSDKSDKSDTWERSVEHLDDWTFGRLDLDVRTFKRLNA